MRYVPIYYIQVFFYVIQSIREQFDKIEKRQTVKQVKVGKRERVYRITKLKSASSMMNAIKLGQLVLLTTLCKSFYNEKGSLLEV